MKLKSSENVTWIWSDLHLGHKKLYTSEIDIPERKRFKDSDEADKYMLEAYLEHVRPGDKVYFLGDVFFGNSGYETLKKMNTGNNYLVMGNHDRYHSKKFSIVFNKIYGVKYLEKAILTHVPIHPRELEFRRNINIHGHTHGEKINDERYINVCVEQTNFKPITLESIL